MRKTVLTALLLVLPAFGHAHEYKVGDIVIHHPVARETAQTAMAGAGYMTITNSGDTADRLIAVEAAFPRVEIHDVKVENDVASMFQVDGVELAPGETITLQPGQKHVMFMGLNGDPFEAGEEVPARLIFEQAGAVDVVFNVETAEQLMQSLGIDAAAHGGHADHGDDDHSNH